MLSQNQSEKRSLGATVKLYFLIKIMKKCQTWDTNYRVEDFTDFEIGPKLGISKEEEIELIHDLYASDFFR